MKTGQQEFWKNKKKARKEPVGSGEKTLQP